MKEIWDQAIIGYNLPLTVLLGLVSIFWIVSLIGVGDLDADLEVDVDGDAASEGSEGVFGFLMRVVNAHDIPVMLVLSMLTLFMWLIAIASNFYLNPGQNTGIALALLLGNFIVSVICLRFVIEPMRPLFQAIKNDQEHQEPLIGSTGKVKSRTLDQTFGQCEVIRPKGAPALLNCRLAEGEPPMVRGDEILVIGHDDETRKFIIKPIKIEETKI